MKELLDLRTLAEIQEAAPVVTAVSLDAATVVVKALLKYASKNAPQDGRVLCGLEPDPVGYFEGASLED